MEYRSAVAAILSVVASLAHAQAVTKADPAKAQQIVEKVCATCHGTDGNSPTPANPIIAGQHADYTYKQLMNFRPQNGKPAERVNAVMAGMVANLAPQDMANLAAYFESQKPKPRTARDPELVRLGQAIYRGGIMAKEVAACASCHSPNGAGMPAQFPRLAGQYAEYTLAQLRAFGAEERANDPNKMMRTIAARMTDREMRAVAEYISGLR